jgi:beta-barrel assembly-enhancing protease
MLLAFFGTNACKSSQKTEDLPVDPAVKKEVAVGRSLAARLAKQYGLVKDEEFTSYLNAVGTSIGKVSSRQELSFRFGILNTEEVNAFACPGGYIFLTKGSLAQIENEAELASVLSHELTHVTLMHSGRFDENQFSFLDVLASIMAPGGDFVGTFTKTAVEGMYGQFFGEGRKKEEEMDADKAGVVYMVQAGYSADGALSYLNKVSKAQNNDTLLKTHPPAKERIDELARFIREQKFPAGGKVNRDRFQTQYKKFKDRNPF